MRLLRPPAPPKPPAPPRVLKNPRPKQQRRPAAFPRGPLLYKATKRVRTADDSGWTTPPEGFVGAHTSATEWMCYLALAKLLGTPANPRRPPFVGGVNWQYQADDPAMSNAGNGRIPGGSVTDFQVDLDGWIIGIRLDTEYFHTTAGAQQVAKDLYLKTHLESANITVTVYDVHFVGDPTGAACMRVMADALRGIERPNPLSTGVFWRVRRAGA